MPAVDDYLENQVLTASPHRLHQMVVEGAIRFARRGQAEMEACRWEAMDESLSRARDCVTEMIGGLNVAVWPEMADSLKSLFVFIYRSLVMAELERDSAQIDNAIRLLQQHRDTWVEVGVKLQTAPTAAAPVPKPAMLQNVSRSWVT